jgi:hypothetical protein
MKTQLWLVLASVMAAAAHGAEPANPTTADPGSAQAAVKAPKGTPVISQAEGQLKAATAPVQYPAHPPPAAKKSAVRTATKPDFEMDVPPPAPLVEKKPTAPKPDLVWVPGYYMPDKGKWVWVAGEWSPPATPSSVWIAPRYDSKEKRWTPGYWQPDRPAPPDPSGPKEASDNPTYR